MQFDNDTPLNLWDGWTTDVLPEIYLANCTHGEIIYADETLLMINM